MTAINSENSIKANKSQPTAFSLSEKLSRLFYTFRFADISYLVEEMNVVQWLKIGIACITLKTLTFIKTLIQYVVLWIIPCHKMCAQMV